MLLPFIKKNLCLNGLLIFILMQSAHASTIIIKNQISPIQIGATVYDNGGQPGIPSINIWPPGSGGGGVTIQGENSYTYPKTVSIKSSTEFGIQINSARLPYDGGQCDQLCNHITVTINSNTSCSAKNTYGTCGANPLSPRWTAKTTAVMLNNTCTITITAAKTPPIVCACKNGSYPCTSNVTCSNKSCPVKPPYQWSSVANFVMNQKQTFSKLN